MVEKVFGRVDNKCIVEYPVFDIHIRNRAHPYAWYTECIYDARPEISRFHFLEEVLTYNETDNKIYITFKIIAISLANLLAGIHTKSMMEFPSEDTEPVNIADVDPAIITRCAELAVELVQKRLDDFAVTRGYDSILSACSYKDSVVPSFADEGAKALVLRDTTWATLYTYINDIQTGAKPVPKSISEIEAQLPKLEWAAVPVSE